MEFSENYFLVAQKFPEKIFKEIKKNQGGKPKNFKKNEHPKNKKMGKKPKKNNFQKIIF